MRFIDGIDPSGPSVTFTFEGRSYAGYPGESIASAMLRAGVQTLRRTRMGGEPRGYFCGMGICWECAVHVQGRGVLRSCAEAVAEGLVVGFADGQPGHD
jgi:sarcosine oxidase subunit alpha